MNWITDFDTGLGAFSKGFEDGQDYIVSYNYGLHENNIHPYSRWHLKHFEVDDDNRKLSDFFIGTPHLGNQISKRGRANFDINELNQCLTLISLKKPDTILLSFLKNGFISLNNLYKKIAYTVDGYPTQDYVVLMLKKMGYYIDRFIIDEANFGIPQHKEFVIYFAQKKDFDPIVKKLNKYREKKIAKPIDFLNSISVVDAVYDDYGYNFKYQDVCKKIKPGSNAKKTKDISQVSGYYRLRPDIPCNSLHHDFYLVSSRGPSIHPTEDRPLSMIEGAYLSGIYMNLWGRGFDRKILGDMIARSIAPNVAWRIKKVVIENLV